MVLLLITLMRQILNSVDQEFTPINTELFPNRVKEKIKRYDVFKAAPILEEYEVYNTLKSKKIKKFSCSRGHST